MLGGLKLTANASITIQRHRDGRGSLALGCGAVALSAAFILVEGKADGIRCADRAAYQSKDNQKLGSQRYSQPPFHLESNRISQVIFPYILCKHGHWLRSQDSKHGALLIVSLIVASLFCLAPVVSFCHEVKRDISYSEDAHKLKKLDLYIPLKAKELPVVIWIHGGGWQVGDKSEVHIKPKFFNGLGYIFVSVNYRLLPDVEMQTIVNDVAESIGWVHQNISDHGGDPSRLLIMGHSAAPSSPLSFAPITAIWNVSPSLCHPSNFACRSMATLMIFRPSSTLLRCDKSCTGSRFRLWTSCQVRQLARTSPAILRGESRIKSRPTPYFLIFYVSGHPDVTAQAFRFRNVLQDAGGGVTCFSAHNTTHSRINSEFGTPDLDTTKALLHILQDLALPCDLPMKSSP